MKTFRITFAATAATMMLVAGLAAACGEKAHATTASNDSAKAGCAKATKACCAKKTSETAGKGCCAKGATTTTAQIGETADVKTCTFRPGAVAFKGTVVCNHCNLKVSETCQTMFRTDNGCVFTLAGDNVEKIKEEAGGGNKLVRIKGTVADDGQLTVSAYRVVRSLSGASAM